MARASPPSRPGAEPDSAGRVPGAGTSDQRMAISPLPLPRCTRSKRCPATLTCGRGEKGSRGRARGSRGRADAGRGRSAPNDGRPSVLSPDVGRCWRASSAVITYSCTRSDARIPRQFLDSGARRRDLAEIIETKDHMVGKGLGWAKPCRKATGPRSSATCATFGLRVPNVHFNDHQIYWRCANTPTRGRVGLRRRGATRTFRVRASIPLVTTSIPLACARGRRTGIGNEFGRAPDVPNLFVSDGSVMNTEAAANAALTVVAPGRPHRGAADGERSPRLGPPGGLRGRTSECALLDDFVSAIRRGESRSVVLRGGLGLGRRRCWSISSRRRQI